MKRICLFIMLVFVASNTLFAQKMKEINLSFNVKDFGIEYNDKSEGVITSTNIDYFYDEDCTLPRIPYIMVNVAIPSSMKFSTLEINETKKLYSDNILLSNNPKILPTNRIAENAQTLPTQYKEGIYPKNRVKFVSSSDLGEFSLLTFKVTPFEYDASKRKLFFSDKVALNVSLEKSNQNPKEYAKSLIDNERLKGMVINPEDIPHSHDSIIPPPIFAPERVDYLIITNEELKPYFNPLVEWKKTKGVRTEVITTEYIDRYYIDATTQLKIKQCLYDYYRIHDLQYVLLGGDDTIVATQGCYASCGRSEYTDMPTDLFYACFGGQFDWNLDGDSIYGEVEDDVLMIPSINVTRAPVRTVDDVTAFVNKILFYEKTPTLHDWNNQILMCGAEVIPDSTQEHSDAKIKGDKLYRCSFENKWTGTRLCFYDTYTDFPEGDAYDFTAQHLQEQIGNGYSFIDVNTHGVDPLTYWKMENGYYYTTTNAARSVGGQPTIITTASCFTNAFDFQNDPCLSEAFIRNPNNGVVAYLGSSREGWAEKGTGLGASLLFEATFYDLLFNNTTPKNYGKLVADTKLSKLPFSNSRPSYRWLLFGINPIGDAEMPIYTSTPSYFENVQVTDNGSNVTIDTGESGCTICLMSCGDMGGSYYEVRNNSQNEIFLDVPDDVSICITKHNHIPYVIKRGDTIIQNQTISGTQTIGGNNVIIGSHVTDSKAYGPVNIQGNITIHGKNVIIKGETTINGNTTIITDNQMGF